MTKRQTKNKRKNDMTAVKRLSKKKEDMPAVKHMSRFVKTMNGSRGKNKTQSGLAAKVKHGPGYVIRISPPPPPHDVAPSSIQRCTWGNPRTYNMVTAVKHTKHEMGYINRVQMPIDV